MPIAFSCTCGKEMKAKEAFAGRKIHCPQCHHVIRIPTAEGWEQGVPVAPRVAQPVAPPLKKVTASPTFTLQKAQEDLPRPALPLLAKPVARQIIPPSRIVRSDNPSVAPADIWVDRSFDQYPTPWLPGDKERFHKGFKWGRAATLGLGIGMFLLVLGGMSAGWYYYLN